MSYRLISTVVAMGTGLALSACAGDVEDPSADPDALASAIEPDGSPSQDGLEDVGQVSEAIERGGGGGGGRGGGG
ncbi:MAG TPA: hypothetical protein VM580_08600, partial [Labilithrix sp.]|nr:hypothetical protein [Labilithrix sp.]